MEVETICVQLPVCIVIFNNDGIYRAPTSTASAPTGTTVFVKGGALRQDDGGPSAASASTRPPGRAQARRQRRAMDSGKPTLINAVLDPGAGSESGRIGNLNPQSKLKKK